MPSRCTKCGKKIQSNQKPVCEACVEKYGMCPRCRGTEERTRSRKPVHIVRSFVYCTKCEKRFREVTPKPSKFRVIEFGVVRYLGKSRLTIDGVPFNVRSVYYSKKLAEGIRQVKSVSGKFIAKRRRFLLTDLMPHISYKHKSYPIVRLKLEALPVECQAVDCGRKGSRRAKKN